MKNRKKDGPSEGTSDLLIIESNLTISSSSSWVLNSDSSAHLCTSMQGLEEVRGLRKGEITLQTGNGARVVVVAVGIYPLRLLLEYRLLLKDYYCVPIANRNLIFISVMARNDYNFYFNKDMCAIILKIKLLYVLS